MAEFLTATVSQRYPSLTGDLGFADANDILRNNGCNSPTRLSIIRVFKAIKSLCMYEKMKNADAAIKQISMEMLVKQLNGPRALLDISGNGIEYSGWYMEIFSLQACKLVTMGRGVITIHQRFLDEFCSDPTEDIDVVHDHLFSEIQKEAFLIRHELVSRIRGFDLVNTLLEVAYAGRELTDEKHLRSDQPLHSDFLRFGPAD